ncbi:hypothetical protein IMZ48_34105 [Candidatus Bathyarchaeota archaeon]|nr:hypothetical protein [Candidatus Bathyarchaeota archaeon]
MKRLDAKPLALLGVALRDHTSAMRLYRLVNFHAKKFGRSKRVFTRMWDWGFWMMKLEALSEDPSVSPLELRDLLSVSLQWQSSWKKGPLPKLDPKLDSMLGDLSISTVSRLEESATDIVRHFATDAPDTRLRRTALHLITTRIRYFKAHGAKLTAPLLAALTRLLILDLEEGQPGRTSRLKWLLELIAENQGHEQAEAVGRELKLWRQRNLQLVQSRPEENDIEEDPEIRGDVYELGEMDGEGGDVFRDGFERNYDERMSGDRYEEAGLNEMAEGGGDLSRDGFGRNYDERMAADGYEEAGVDGEGQHFEEMYDTDRRRLEARLDAAQARLKTAQSRLIAAHARLSPANAAAVRGAIQLFDEPPDTD